MTERELIALMAAKIYDGDSVGTYQAVVIARSILEEVDRSIGK
jgi:hypothetical protein